MLIDAHDSVQNYLTQQIFNNSPMSDLISIIMPVFNSEDYLPESIESILNQSHDNIEFIVIDDCSTDKSLSIIQEYAKHDNRMIVIKNSINLGVTDSLNIGISISKGKYIARMDSDDISFVDRIEKQASYLEDYDIIFGNVIYIDGNGEDIGFYKKRHTDFAKEIIIKNPIIHPTTLFKRELVKNYGNYDKRFIAAEDYELWVRFFCNGARFFNIGDTVLKYRQHKSQVKSKLTKRTILSTVHLKLFAYRNYGFRLGIKGWSRIIAECMLLALPAFFIVKLFYIISIDKSIVGSGGSK